MVCFHVLDHPDAFYNVDETNFELKPSIKRVISRNSANHRSHINVHLFKWCKDRGIRIISFPPNCMHILQMCNTNFWTNQIRMEEGN